MQVGQHAGQDESRDGTTLEAPVADPARVDGGPAQGHGDPGLDGHGHASHGHGLVRLSRRAVRLSLAVIVPAAVLVVVAMALLWPRDGHPVDTGGGSLRAGGQVRAVHHAPCPQVDPAAAAAGAPSDCGTVQVEVTDGPGTGQLVDTDVPAGPGAVRVSVGDRCDVSQWGRG